MDYQALAKEISEVLWQDVDQSKAFPEYRPVLAHYTSVESIEKILSSNEIWFSHPFAMNDAEELTFGVKAARSEFLNSEVLKAACPSPDVYEALITAFHKDWEEYDEGALDTYVFCLSEHTPGDQDGRLPMWTRYGANGKGVAAVISTENLQAQEAWPNLIIAPVEYMSGPKRIECLQAAIGRLAAYIREKNPRAQDMGLYSYLFLYRAIFFSLYTKHQGFDDEKEWRVVYIRPWGETAHLDQARLAAFDSMLGYSLGSSGVHPKFKFNCANMPNSVHKHISELIDYVILGPLAGKTMFEIQSIRRMFKHLGHPQLADSLAKSTLPYRGS